MWTETAPEGTGHTTFFAAAFPEGVRVAAISHAIGSEQAVKRGFPIELGMTECVVVSEETTGA